MPLKMEKMERGRGQLLQRYRPEQTFDHESHFIAHVVEYRPDPRYDQALDRAKLIEEGVRYVRRWRADARRLQQPRESAPTFPPDTVAASFYDVIVPTSLSFTYFPRTVTCKNPECQRVYVLPQTPEQGQELGKCPSCKSDPSYQLQYLLVHGCGVARQFEPPRNCDNGCRGNKGFRLDTRASRFRDFRWICRQCGAAKELTEFCDNRLCRMPSPLMQPEVHTSGSAYVPHTVKVVNPAAAGDRAVVHTEEYRLGIVGQWLDVCSPSELDALQSGHATRMNPALRETIDLLREVNPQKAAEMEAKFAPLDLQKLKERIASRIGQTVVDDSAALSALASQLETYDRTVRKGAVTLEALRKDAVSDSRRALYDRYPLVLSEAGLDPMRVVLVPDFPVIEVAVGYSRGGYTAKEADLRSYQASPRKGQPAKTVFYAHPQLTEALVLGLDRIRVARWLDVNGLASIAETGGADGIVNWFARYLSSKETDPAWIEFEENPPPESRGGDALLRLMHSMSHQFIRALSVDSGFMETSLSEHFFPYHLSFAIYPRANGEFVIGGLRTVMEQNLDEVVRRALDNDTCLYDPNCTIANKGADHGCLFLPETACSFRNRNTHLSRWDLFGSPEGALTGYWDFELLE